MGLIALNIDETNTLSVESRMNRLGLESAFTSNVIETFRSVVPDLKENIVNAFNMLTTPKDELAKNVDELVSHFKKLEKKIPHASFLNIGQTVVSVPEGFKGNLLTYLNFLHLLSDELVREANNVLVDYNMILSSFVSNKQDKLSLRDHTALFKKVKHRREEIMKDIKEFFPDTNVTARSRLIQICDRFQDLEAMYKLSEQLLKERKSHNLENIHNGVRQSVEMLDMVIQDVQTNGTENVSGASALNISEGAYEIGKFVELVAIYRTMVDQAILTTNRLMKQLDDIL